MNRLLAIGLLSSALGACGAGEAFGPPRQLVPAPANPNLIVYVSNQSFDIDPVDIQITFDRQPLIEGDFLVEGQHNWLRFDFGVEAGVHQLSANSSESPTQTVSIATGNDTRFAVVNFWYYPPGSGDPTGPELVVDVYDEQPYFE